MYMAHNIQVRELIRSVAEWREGSSIPLHSGLAYKKYTLGLPRMINELLPPRYGTNGF